MSYTGVSRRCSCRAHRLHVPIHRMEDEPIRKALRASEFAHCEDALTLCATPFCQSSLYECSHLRTVGWITRLCFAVGETFVTVVWNHLSSSRRPYMPGRKPSRAIAEVGWALCHSQSRAFSSGKLGQLRWSGSGEGGRGQAAYRILTAVICACTEGDVDDSVEADVSPGACYSARGSHRSTVARGRTRVMCWRSREGRLRHLAWKAFRGVSKRYESEPDGHGPIRPQPRGCCSTSQSRVRTPSRVCDTPEERMILCGSLLHGVS